MRKTSRLVASSGRSTKKISSKRPLRRNSGGRRWMSLAVATTKTSPLRSCIHPRKLPRMRWETPPSSEPPAAKAFSSSSIHSTTGAIRSAARMARLKFPSLSPTYLL